MSQSMRLDAAIAVRGLAQSRSRAARLITDGLVTVDGVGVVRASMQVRDTQDIAIAGADHYVSRAAHKLAAGLDSFGIDPSGMDVLDVGASTGGFTQVLLERGARSVVALDVGHGQLADLVRGDSRVSVVEGFNARGLSLPALAEAVGRPIYPHLLVADVSFISLALLVEGFRAVLGESGQGVVLVKPQFEVGRSGIREGVVRDPALRREAVTAVMWSAWDAGLGTAGICSSPIVGSAGNHEYLLWLSGSAGSNPTEWLDRVAALCGD